MFYLHTSTYSSPPIQKVYHFPLLSPSSQRSPDVQHLLDFASHVTEKSIRWACVGEQIFHHPQRGLSPTPVLHYCSNVVDKALCDL